MNEYFQNTASFLNYIYENYHEKEYFEEWKNLKIL